MKSIPEYTSVTPEQFFSDIAQRHKPVVVRGLNSQWPMVRAAKQNNRSFTDYILRYYQGVKAKMVVAPPAENKRFYYNQDFTDVNYLQGEERIDLFLNRLLELVDRAVYPAISMQNALCESILPGLSKDNTCDFFPDLEPRMWIGNEGIVSAHYDGSDNLACVIAGKRRFLLFSPEQTKNLYPGSLNFTPAGAPTTLVNFSTPDFNKFPHFQTALENAYEAVLYPGDAIYIPMLWWHHVESLNKVNGLLNYWWNGSSAPNAIAPSALDSLNLALLAMRDLNPKQREAWSHMFDHYLFQQGVKPTSYIPESAHHILGELSDEQLIAWQKRFVQRLQN